ncbi:MAG: DNA repair protein RecO [Chloroflexi bacterium]|nr:DNA repair protein RecO [Chloroflexota bacterium]
MSEFRSFRLEAVVLRHSTWGEADRLLVLYSRERGKIRALAKGVRRIKSRKAGHLEPFTRVTLQLARGRDLPVITQVETVEAYLPLRDDLLRTGYAAYTVELLDRFTYEAEHQNPAIYRLLADTLGRIAGEESPWAAVRHYEIRLLDFMGFRPQLSRCVNCREDIRPVAQYFSPAQGGALCPRCGEGLRQALPVTVEALKYLRHFQRSSYPDARRARPLPQVQAEVEALMQRFVTYLLERELNSPGFLSRIKKEEGL